LKRELIALGLIFAVTILSLGQARAHAVAAQQGAAPWKISLDCNPNVSGVQSECDYSLHDSVDVLVVLENLSAGETPPPNSLSFRVLGGGTDDPSLTVPNKGVQALAPAPGVDANLNGNPDLSETITGSWDCSSPAPSITPLANGIEFNASLSCHGSGGPTVPANGSLVLGTLHFAAVGSPGMASMSVRFPKIVAGGSTLIDSCTSGGPAGTNPAECGSTTVWIDRAAATPIATPPTATTSPVAIAPTTPTRSTPSAGSAALPSTGSYEPHSSNRLIVLAVWTLAVGVIFVAAGARRMSVRR
jgi:hypothetical protein